MLDFDAGREGIAAVIGAETPLMLGGFHQFLALGRQQRRHTSGVAAEHDIVLQLGIVIRIAAIEGDRRDHPEADLAVKADGIDRSDVAGDVDAKVLIEGANQPILEGRRVAANRRQHPAPLITIADFEKFGRLWTGVDDLDVIQVIGARRRQVLGETTEQHMAFAGLNADADIWQQLVVLHRPDKRRARIVGRRNRCNWLTRAISETSGRGVTELVQLTLEIGCAQSEADRQEIVKKLTAIFTGKLIKQCNRQTVAGLEHIAVQRVDRNAVPTTEHIVGVAARVEEGELPGLAVPSPVISVGKTQQIVGVDVPDQRGVEAVTPGVGVVRAVEPHGIKDIAVTVEVDTWLQRKRSRRIEACTLKTLILFRHHFVAAAVGEDILEGGVDGQRDAFSDRELALAANIASVRRIDEQVEIAAVNTGRRTGACVERRDAFALHGASTRRWPSAEIGPVNVRVCQELAQTQVPVKIIPVAVIVTKDRDEVAVVADGLINPGVQLGLLQGAWPLELVIFGVGGGEERPRVPRPERTGVEHRDPAPVAVFTQRRLGEQAHVLGRLAGDVIDGAAGRRCGRAVNIGRPDVHHRPLDQFRIQLLVGEDGVVTGIVERDTVLQQRDAVAVKAAQTQVTTRVAVRIVVDEVIAGGEVQRLQDRLTRILGADIFLIDGRPRLRGLLRNDDALRLGAGAGDDNFFNRLRTCRLRHGAGCRNQTNGDGRRRGAKTKCAHVSVPLCGKYTELMPYTGL